MQLPYGPAIVLLSIYPRDMKAYIYTKNLYMNVHSSFTGNSSKLESVQMSFNKRLVKQTVVHPPQGVLFNKKKECTVDTHATWMVFKNMMLSEKSQPQKFIYCMI